MRVVIDTSYFIDRDIPFKNITVGYIPESVERELKDTQTCDYYKLHDFTISVRNPKETYVAEVKEAVQNKHFSISEADVDVVALMLELSDELNSEWIGKESLMDVEQLVCLTKDNGIRSALSLFDLYDDPHFLVKKYKLRCFGCYEIYEKDVDFCRKCGHNTIARVSVVGEGENERVLLSKHFKYRPKVLKDDKGVVIRSEDQKEYIKYKENLKRKRFIP